MRTARDLEVLSGNCPPERPCSKDMIAAYRREYGHGLGDWIACIIHRLGFRKTCKQCAARQQWFNKVGDRLKHFGNAFHHDKRA